MSSGSTFSGGSSRLGSTLAPMQNSFGGGSMGRGGQMGMGMGMGGGQFGAGQFGAGQFGQGQFGAGQFGAGQMGRQNTRRSFIGSDSADLTNIFSMMNQGGGLSRSGLQNLRGGQQNRRNGDFQQPDNDDNGRDGSRRTAVATRFALGFEPAVSTGRISLAVSKRLERYGKDGRLGIREPIQLLRQGSTTILRGSVATVHDRDLVERLVRLEAGIGQIQSDLTVASNSDASSSAESSSAPPTVDGIAPAGQTDSTVPPAPTVEPER
jgi:hypothetical protein